MLRNEDSKRFKWRGVWHSAVWVLFALATLAPLSDASAQTSDRSRDTLLHMAVIDGDEDAIRRLFDQGYSCTAQNESGETPLHVLAKRQNASTAVLDLLLAHGAPVNAMDHFGYTPLHEAALNGDAHVVGKLLSKGADPNMKTVDGNTSLHYAVISGSLAKVKNLLQAGADSGAKNATDNTPLHWVAGRENANPGILRLLLAYGADREAKNKDGETPLDRAHGNGNISIAGLLSGTGSDSGLRLVVKEKGEGLLVALLKSGGKWFLIIFLTSLGVAVASRVLFKSKAKHTQNGRPQDKRIT